MKKQEKIETISINGVEYVEASKVKSEVPVIKYTGKETLVSAFIGTPCICRSYNSGLNIGIVEMADETGVVLKDARRIWYHKPKDKALSWYEGVAKTGLSNDSKVSGTVDRKIIVERYELVACSKDIYNSIMEKKPNAQS